MTKIKAATTLRCPHCGSTSLIRHGWQWRLSAQSPKVQRYRCNSCGRFTVRPRGDG